MCILWYYKFFKFNKFSFFNWQVKGIRSEDRICFIPFFFVNSTYSFLIWYYSTIWYHYLPLFVRSSIDNFASYFTLPSQMKYFNLTIILLKFIKEFEFMLVFTYNQNTRRTDTPEIKQLKKYKVDIHSNTTDDISSFLFVIIIITVVT